MNNFRTSQLPNVTVALYALFTCLLVAGCSSPRTDATARVGKAEIVQSSVRFHKEYVLFPGDQVEISVWRVPELSRSISVGPDGKISLPLAQDVQAAGLTARELAKKLKEIFSARLLEPEVTVIPISVRQPVVHVMGDVKNPTSMPYRASLTALQAVGNAGGLLRSSAASDVTIIRLSADGYLSAIPVEVLAGGQPGPYMGLALAKLEPDDVVFVPETARSEIVRFMQDLVLPPLQVLLSFKLMQSL